jgi:L-rhamnose isomerase
MELTRSLPWGAVWDELCERDGVPPGAKWLGDVARHERTVQSKRR